MRVVARAPNHLGDGVMALPALRGLSRLGALTIHAPRWGPELYRELDAFVEPVGHMARADLAVVFPPSLRTAWQARRSTRRVGGATDRRSWLLTDPVPWTPRTADLYARLAEVAGTTAEGDPVFRAALSDTAAEVPDGHVGIAPLSATGSTREWSGFAAVADVLAEDCVPVVFYGGPGERERIAAVAGRHRAEIGQGLGDLAATLQRCSVLLTNDSGLAHFGRACGVAVVTIFGSTHPGWTGAPGAVAVRGPALPCAPCRASRCRVGDHGCLQIPIEVVLGAVRGTLGG